MLEHLRDAALEINALSEELKSRLMVLDNAISRCVEKGDFCWSANVQPAYPPQKFWFLYAVTRKPRTK